MRLKIEESKQVGILYRTIDIRYLREIIDNDCLTSGNNNIICCSRDKNYYKSCRPLSVTLVLDGDKISENYKIYPHMNKDEDKLHFNEFEERIKGPVYNIKRYILKIIVPKRLKENALFLMHLGEFGFTSYEDLIFYIISNGIKVYSE